MGRPLSFLQLFEEETKSLRRNSMDQLIPLISDVGFPIVVTLYLLHRIEAKLDSVVQIHTESARQFKGKSQA